MRLVLDLQAVQGAARYRGLGRYSLEFAAAMAVLPDVREPIVLLNGGLANRTLLESRRLVASRIPRCSIEVFSSPWPGLTDARDPAAHQEAEVVRDQFIQELAPDAVVVCSPFSSPFESVLSIAPRGLRPPTTAIVYDMLQLTDPDSRLAAQDEGWYQHRLDSLRNADELWCISDFTAWEVQRVLGASCPPTRTIWGAGFSLDDARAASRSGVIVAGGDGRRKNEAATIRAFAMLPPALRAANPLTVLGRQSHPDLDPGAIAEACGLRPGEYEIVGHEITDEELAQRYAAASVVSMPSRGEGLGMPVLEAWRHGTPVIASNVTSLPQLIDDDRWLFGPDDHERQAQILTELLTDPGAWQAAVRHAEERSRLFTWDACAGRAYEGLAELVPSEPPPVEGRSSLAFVTPWQPQDTGIARHAQVMAQALAQYYSITVVNDDPAARDSVAAAGFAALDVDSFTAAEPPFDRILVQLGNNPHFHAECLKVLRNWPSVVVAHDTDLIHLVRLTHGAFPGGIAGARYSEDGIEGLRSGGSPVGVDLLRSGIGVIVHSGAAQEHLTKDARSRIPSELVQLAPLVLISELGADSRAARAALGIGDDEVLVATFGRVEPEKGTHTVIEAVLPLLRQGLPIRFVVVGSTQNSKYRRRLESLLEGTTGRLTDAVADVEYSQWLSACDIAVQLRPGYRGETSGALVEVLGAGCATIVESVGSMTELAEYGAIALQSPVSADALRVAIESLVTDTARRRELQLSSAAKVDEIHGPAHVAALYADAIEDFHHRYGLLPQRMPRTAAQVRSMAANRPDRVGPTLYVDITSIVETNRRTGIERVAASLCPALASVFPGRVIPVYEDAFDYRHALTALPELVGEDVVLPDKDLVAGIVRFREGDILLCPETKGDVPRLRQQTAAVQAYGARFVQIVHDLLPARLPDFFPGFVADWFDAWLNVVVENADVLVCNSQATESDLRRWLHEEAPALTELPDIGWVRLACDLASSPLVGPQIQGRRRGSRRVLTVGTVEPRKGVDVVLDAAEALWARGEDVEFVIVGRAGWAGGDLIRRLRALDESPAPLTWLTDASDIDLQAEYLTADLLVMASRGEGFGLPIVEALAHGVPVVARELEVFREILGPDGDYFLLDAELPDAIVQRLRSDAPPAYLPDRVVTWRETAGDLLAVLGVEPRSD